MKYHSYIFINVLDYLEVRMGTEGIEPPADGLEPPILPLNYAP